MAVGSREWREVERRRGKYRRLFKKVFQKALDKQIEPFLKDIQFINPNNTTFQDIPIDNTGVEKAYVKLYKTVGLDFAEDERDKFIKSAPKRMQTKADEFTNSEFNYIVEQYLRTGLVGANITSVGDTSQEHLQKLLNQIILEVQDQNLSTSVAQTMLRDRLKSRWHRDMRFRTARIVRTEISAASNWGQIEGVKSTGLPTNKFWVAAFDERTRQAHADANGQMRDINQPFEVGGELMMQPLDSSLGATASNIVNCRCTTTFQLKSMTI